MKRCLGFLIGSVWVFHGVFSKILGGIPRHQLIVERILGPGHGRALTLVIGCLELLLGVWAWSGRWRVACAAVQTLAIAVMNAIEIWLARDLLISAPGMVALNAAFLSLVWHWALPKGGTLRERLSAVRRSAPDRRP